MRLYKPSHKDRKGNRQYSKKWYIKGRDNNQIMRIFPGFPDKRQTELLKDQIERLVNCKMAGERPDSQLTRFIEGMGSKLRRRLVDLELLDRRSAIAGEPLTQHIEDFFQSLLAKENTLKRVKGVTSKVRRIVKGCKFETWNNIQSEAVENYLKQLRNNGKGISIQTRNWYLQAIKQFCKWMVQNGRANKSPLKYLSGLNVKDDKRHDRRALKIDEVRRLLETTKIGPARFGMSGYERYLLYKVAIETGLRRNELRNLKVSSFDFKALTLVVRSGYTKNKDEAIQSLRPDTAAELKQFFMGKLPNVKVFGGTYKQLTDKTAKMIQADLADAGIDYQDNDGKYFDFHALRGETGTLLAISGVHPKTIQSIMRHSDINLTMNRYTHIFKSQESEAIAKLPDLSKPSKQRKSKGTGTNG